ncbi:MAG: gliding motility-associated C-terminal domain-containing protein [Sphingobacterium sp.]|jgi:gliding motility-associated-like protein|nr:gliding motility-associated C-terminal domain-containing protein [Sphingobacterium sp.]
MMKFFFIYACLLLSTLRGHGQDGTGSILYSNGQTILTERQFKAVYAESLFIDANAVWQIDGQLDLYVKNIWIAPTAKISGKGVLNIHSPAKNPFYSRWVAQPTHIDANGGNYIDVNIELLNEEGLHLTDMVANRDNGITAVVEKNEASLKLAKAINLAVDGANIFLNGHDFELGENGTILNHSYKRFVVTNGAKSGYLIKRNSHSNSEFLFPVGKDKGDYTPALLKPSLPNSKVYVSVTDYLTSGLYFENKEIGMDRVWNIFADRAMLMDYTLIHQVSSNGTAYIDPAAQVMQYVAGGNWIGDVTYFKEKGRQAIHTRRQVEAKAGKALSGTWFTKLSNTPLVAKDDYAVVVYGNTKAIHVLENDKPGSSPIRTNSVRIVTPPMHTNVYVENGAVICEANADFVGNDEFEYEITDRNGLTAKAKVYLKIVPRDLYIPNVFTPNGDGKNDTYVISGMEGYERVELIVVDRFGIELFREENYKNGWTGQGLKEGTYYYNVTAINGTYSRLYKGTVLIKRK